MQHPVSSKGKVLPATNLATHSDSTHCSNLHTLTTVSDTGLPIIHFLTPAPSASFHHGHWIASLLFRSSGLVSVTSPLTPLGCQLLILFQFHFNNFMLLSLTIIRLLTQLAILSLLHKHIAAITGTFCQLLITSSSHCYIQSHLISVASWFFISNTCLLIQLFYPNIRNFAQFLLLVLGCQLAILTSFHLSNLLLFPLPTPGASL